MSYNSYRNTANYTLLGVHVNQLKNLVIAFSLLCNYTLG